MVGITQPAMVSVLQTWEQEGIVYKIGKSGRYAGLLKLPTKTKMSSASDKKKRRRPKKQQTKADDVLAPLAQIENNATVQS
jgi:hypothetical protein